MNCCIEQIDGVSIIVLPGETLDAGNSKEFKREMEPLLKENARLVFDMSQMRFIDSSGCGALLSCLRKLNA
jgi:anti-sigma B factor antagonist